MCIRLLVSHVQYDTVDQAVVPITIVNECAEEAFVEVIIRDSNGNTIFSNIEKLDKDRKSIEAVLLYYGDAEVCGEWWTRSSPTRIKVDCMRVKL